MGVPTMGTGPTTAWSDDSSGYDAGPYNLPNDGSQWSFTTVMVLIARLINSVGALYSGGSMQVGAYSGASFTIAAGALVTFLRLLADKAANLDAGSNTFRGKMLLGAGATDPGANGLGVGGNEVVVGAAQAASYTAIGGMTFGGLFTPNGSTARVRWRQGAIPDASTSTIDVTAETWWISGQSQDIVITLDKATHVPAAGERLRVLLYNMTTYGASFLNGSGGATISTDSDGSGGAYRWCAFEFEFIDGNWHLAGQTGTRGNNNTTSNVFATNPEGV